MFGWVMLLLVVAMFTLDEFSVSALEFWEFSLLCVIPLIMLVFMFYKHRPRSFSER
ncbi:MAG: hypothetical protein R3C11_24255 [Planctomycetaceae bacterium]